MKTKKTTLQQFLLAAAMALPLAAHAANGLDGDTAAYGGPGAGAGAGNGGGPGMDAHCAHAYQEGPRGLDGGCGPTGGPAGRPDGRGGPGGTEPRGPGFGPGPRGMFFRPPPFLHGLALNETQQDKVFAILHAQAPYVRDQGKALRKAQEALHALGGADKYDDAKAASLSQAAALAMSNLELQRVRTEQKLLAVLTGEQRKQLDQHQAPRPQHQ